MIDVWDKLGITIEGASFSQLVSTALSSALESFRRNKIIPDRTGEEYTEMMNRFPAPRHSMRGRALDVNAAMFGQDIPAVVPESLEVRRDRRRLEELRVKLRAAPESITEAEIKEHAMLADKFFDEG